MGFAAAASEAPLAPSCRAPSFLDAMLARVLFVKQGEREVTASPNQSVGLALQPPELHNVGPAGKRTPAPGTDDA
eukprot:13628204-Alexandrium_andersonii.AAC.1